MKNWKLAEEALENAAKKEGLNYKRIEGEAAFYGPKLDFMFRDSLGREWQLATIQCDFNLPERFELEYTDEDGSKQRPVVIHRAISGSLERFLGVYIEHVAGWFPFWLSPTQVKILTVNNEQETMDYVAKIRSILDEVVLMKPLKYNEIRYEVDDRNESLGKKIREATMMKIPMMLIVGPKDIKAGEVSVRTQEGEEKVKLDLLQSYITNIS
jgi:threonyl-tRNA synthetase